MICDFQLRESNQNPTWSRFKLVSDHLLNNKKIYDSFSGNEDTFQDDGSKNPLNVSENHFAKFSVTKIIISGR